MSNQELTIEEKANYLRMALALTKVVADNKVSELIIRLYEGIIEKGGKFSLRDAAEIETIVEKKYTPEPKTEQP